MLYGELIEAQTEERIEFSWIPADLRTAGPALR
jgi:hypothetical protein